jgi:hypothetical protein
VKEGSVVWKRVQELWGGSGFFRGAVVLAGLCVLALLATDGSGHTTP